MGRIFSDYHLYDTCFGKMINLNQQKLSINGRMDALEWFENKNNLLNN